MFPPNAAGPDEPSSVHPEVTRKEAGEATRAGRVVMNDAIAEAVAANLLKGMSPKRALMDVGFSESYAAKNGRDAVHEPRVQQRLTEALNEVGLSIPEAAQDLKALTRAEKVVTAKDRGVITDEKSYADNTTRLGAVRTTFELHGALKSGSERHGGAEGPRRLVLVDARYASIFFGDEQLGSVQAGADVPGSTPVPQEGDRPGGGGRDGQE